MPVPSLLENIFSYSNVLPGARVTHNFGAENNTLLQTSTIQKTILCWRKVTLPSDIIIICSFAGLNNFALLLDVFNGRYAVLESLC